jgi:chlorite dismutase
VNDSRLLSHFAVYGLRPSYWELGDEQRDRVSVELRSSLAAAAEAVHLYHTFGTAAKGDAIVWSSVPAGDSAAPARFFQGYRQALRPFRRYIEVQHALWGLTADSQYSRGAPERGIDPFTPRSSRYLVIYPFAKTHEWYRMSLEDRKRMMSSHIRVGLEHEGVYQLLLYSTGLQDHEFVVVYETDDLACFSRLVVDLRSTEARGYTLLDTPVHVGVYCGPDDPGARAWP